jgi:hypothetical protein
MELGKQGSQLIVHVSASLSCRTARSDKENSHEQSILAFFAQAVYSFVDCLSFYRLQLQKPMPFDLLPDYGDIHLAKLSRIF